MSFCGQILIFLIFQLPVNTSELAVSNVKRPNLKRSKYGLSEAPYSNVGVKSPLNNGKKPHHIQWLKIKQKSLIFVKKRAKRATFLLVKFMIYSDNFGHFLIPKNSNETFFLVIFKQCAVVKGNVYFWSDNAR